MSLDQITPIVITWNEEPNIKRVFEQLTGAHEGVVVVYNSSNDSTLELLAGSPKAAFFANWVRTIQNRATA